MHEQGFDRLARSLSGGTTRRGALGGLVAIWLTARGALYAPDNASAGCRQRRGGKGQNHNNRNKKRKDNRDRPPRGGFADCARPGTEGQPCQDQARGFVSRCCGGVCYVPRADCLGTGSETSVPCAANSAFPCRDADRLCCSGVAGCDIPGCICLLGEPGDPCSGDRDCDSDRCVCGVCQ